MATEAENSKYLLGPAHLDSEVKRLAKQHRWIHKALNEQIVFAPVDLQKPGLSVLDIGCADGTLLRDLQKQVPPSAELVGAELVGVNFMPGCLPTENPSGNIRYVQHDVVKPFPDDLAGAFDLTHVRHVFPGIAPQDCRATMENLVSSLAPGGWLQVHELNVSETAPDLDVQPLADVLFVTRKLWALNGVKEDFHLGLAELFKEAGLVNVEVKLVAIPVGKKAEDETAAAESIELFAKETIPMWLAGAAHLGAVVPDSVADNLADRFEKAMKECGGIFQAVIVFGQKPAS